MSKKVLEEIKENIRQLGTEKNSITKIEFKGEGKTKIWQQKKLILTQDDEKITIEYISDDKKRNVEEASSNHELIIRWLDFVQNIEDEDVDLKSKISEFICKQTENVVAA